MPIIGSLQPRVSSLPTTAVTSSGNYAVELAAAAGLFLDPWQANVLDLALGEREDEKWSAFEVAMVISRQNGKGPHSLDTRVLTTDGWTTFADIKVGQHVYGADGLPTRVDQVSPILLGLDCYRVTFTDGAQHVVAGSHLWHVLDVHSPGTWRDVTTEEIAARFGRRRANGRMEYRYRVRCDAVVETPDTELPIDPYLLGYWLGDGTSEASCITVGHQDLAWTRARIRETGAEIVRELTYPEKNRLFFRMAAKMRDGFEARCRRLGVWGNKHIPEVYLTASPKQRLALLAGLMDSDGSAATTNRSAQVEFTTSIPDLARGFHRLARSLGIRVTPKVGATSLNGVRYRDRTRFLWTPAFNPFELPRKARRVGEPASRRHELMSITNVERVDPVATRCIKIARADGVYLVGELFTPTHNTVLEARELAGLFLFGERLILHTAHEFKTAADAFRRVSTLIESVPEFDGQVAKVTRSHGDEGIELKSGQRLRFIARTSGSGRGFPADLVILDEAYNLPETAMSALLPTLTTSPNPQIWYASSAVNQEFHQHGLVLSRVRRRALRGNDPRLCYLEWSVDRDEYEADPEKIARDKRYIAMANPAYGSPRLTEDYVDGERSALWGVDGKLFAVERLSIGDWPAEADEDSLIPRTVWNDLRNREPRRTGSLVFGIDAPPSRATASIGSASWTRDGKVFVEVIPEPFRHAHRGLGWVVKRCVELNAKWKPACFVIDRGSPAASLVPALEEAGLVVRTTDSTQFAVACGGFYDAVMDSVVQHGNQVSLDTAVAGVETRKLTDRWAFSRIGRTNVAPLCAVTVARYGLEMWGKPKVIATPIVEKTGGANRAATDDLATAGF